MSFDEVLIRDSCGKSRSIIKKYFYYNEYDKENFPFISDYEELTLLDLLEGQKSIIDVIPLFVPYVLIILLAIICIGVWISICCCSRKPKCFLKKDNVHTNRTRFICLMVFYGFALSIIVLGIVLLVYISYAEEDFNGTICSLLMMQYEIINGQGFLAKKKIYKPYWYGSKEVGKAIQDINTLLESLKTTCDNNVGVFQSNYILAENAGNTLTDSLEHLYTDYKDSEIVVTDDESLGTVTIPIYISNLGPKENNETYTGRIYEGYKKNFEYILEEIILPVTGLCSIMSSDGGEYLSSGLQGFESVIDNLNTILENLSSTITSYITKYSHYIVNFGYKVNLALFSVITTATTIECILYIIYYFRPFSLLKYNTYIFIHIINITLILCIIYNGIFGILSLLTGNMADIVDAAFSKENFSSENPRLIGGGTEIKKLTRCLRGDGDLFDEFVTEEVKNIIEPLTQLYFLYTPTKKVNEKITNTERNEYSHLISIDTVIEELDAMKDDFLLSTTPETSNNNDISIMLDELTKYTMAGRRYQKQCAKATYDIWTTNSAHCPLVQAGGNLISGQCQYINDYITPPNYQEGAISAARKYHEACELIDKSSFLNVESAVKKYIMTFAEYKGKNEDLINNLLDDSSIGLNLLKQRFEDNFIEKIKDIMPTINNDITGKVHEIFSKLLNDTTEDSSKLKNSNNFNLFSWMNCTAIGQDYNATLSTLKSNLTQEMRVITYCSLVCEFLLIANLYIMVGLSKNLRDKIFEINDARNVSHSSDNIEEIQVNTIKETKNEEDDEIYAIKNKKKFDVDENVDKKLGRDVKKELDKDGNGITHPAIVSINGPDGRCAFENGENAHNKFQFETERNNINTDKESKEMSFNRSVLNSNSKIVEVKNLPKPKKNIILSDNESNGSEKETNAKPKSKFNKSALSNFQSAKNVDNHESMKIVNKELPLKSIMKGRSTKALMKKKTDKKSGGTVSSSDISFD
jgi:hypothetical protein